MYKYMTLLHLYMSHSRDICQYLNYIHQYLQQIIYKSYNTQEMLEIAWYHVHHEIFFIKHLGFHCNSSYDALFHFFFIADDGSLSIARRITIMKTTQAF